MLVRIRYSDTKYDMIKHTRIDDLIQAREIQSFYRSSGWADVKKDRLRGNGGGLYLGPERRHDPPATADLITWEI